MMIRNICFGAFLATLALTGPAAATGGCGVGCHSTSQGACVRDGWQEGLPVWNVACSPLRPISPMESAISDVRCAMNYPV